MGSRKAFFKSVLKMAESGDYSGYDPAKSAVNSLEIKFLSLYFSTTIQCLKIQQTVVSPVNCPL